MPDYFSFDPHPRAPSRKLPPHACDSQFHVFGPADRYPVAPGSAYQMPTATAGRALHMHATLGFERGVIVQSTTYGANCQNILDGLAAAGPGYRGCAHAAVLKEQTDSYLSTLHDAGVRGARFTRAGLGSSLEAKDIERALARAQELGWYVKLQPEMNGLAETISPFRHLDVPLIIDHMGRPDPEAGDADPSLRCVLDMLAEGNTWVMLSLPEKISRTGPPWDDASKIARRLVETAPNRCIWGSDWPHPVSVKQPPNEADLVEFLYRCVPDDSALTRILVDNPAHLFQF
ncbi:4-sulfomuconolactone hydrolase [Pigmentiphaga humi]|uniref:4-sulfomuconolactone hydrolase n=1 Tax=Pigmentiphaga humi TaxID=2478468 RepID=A0A3P4B5S1_9BURK|nr:amidohydrolase family protein [Pigmentiphaga humi]VCU71653.1 4-sulfomuconolactone hydrolase [Pigmentiphaga humi]